MGKTKNMNSPLLLSRVPVASPLTMAMKAAERGYVSDQLIRIAIRRLLKSRLRQLRPTPNWDPVPEFLSRIQGQPVAVATDEANQQHYEVSAKFYQQVLGPRLKYSCCYWDETTESLGQAEIAALSLTCQHAAIEDGDEILELGCGWGSLSLWMAEHYPHSRITAISNSESQKRFIEGQAARLGLQNLRVITSDINNFRPTVRYDRIVSVEMFEHVRNHQELMKRIRGWLHENGTLFVHLFCHRQSPYLFETTGAQNWMGRYFFTGGMMPSADLLPRVAGQLKLADQWTWPGTHYAKTCRAWLDRQDRASASLQPVFTAVYGQDQALKWHQRWRLFFMACEELFAYRGGDEWFVSHYLFSR